MSKFSEEKLAYFKQKLLKARAGILTGDVLASNDDLLIDQEDLSDETDIASSIANQNISFNIRHRELEKLRRIEEALLRIKDGSYGFCMDCDIHIGEKRLENQPWTEFCIVHAEEREREQQKFAKNG